MLTLPLVITAACPGWRLATCLQKAWWENSFPLKALLSTSLALIASVFRPCRHRKKQIFKVSFKKYSEYTKDASWSFCHDALHTLSVSRYNVQCATWCSLWKVENKKSFRLWEVGAFLVKTFLTVCFIVSSTTEPKTLSAKNSTVR